MLTSNQYRRQEYHTARRGGKRRGKEKEDFFVVSSRNYKITLKQSGTHFLITTWGKGRGGWDELGEQP